MTINVVLADDHPVVRSGIRTLLEKAPDIVVIGEAGDGYETLEMVSQLKPHVLLLDMELPGLKGIEVAQRLKADGAAVHILALSAYDDEQYIFGLLSTGAVGYMTKDEALATITSAVRGVAGGEIGWLSRRVTAKVMQRKIAPPQDFTDPLTMLSARERQVLQQVASGNPNDQIASVLCISDGTVKNHITNIYSKLNVRTRAEAVAWAWKHGIVKEAEIT